MKLLERIDLALQHARKSRGDLAGAIGLSVQSISNLKRRPASTLRPENIAKAAAYLQCDLYWLCTGEPEDYQAAKNCTPAYSFLASEVARWLDALPKDEQAAAFARIYQICADFHVPMNLAPRRDGDGKARGSLAG